jgi:hypothetical protein
MRVFEIEATGIITNTKSDCSKRACSEIKLIIEISLYEVMLSIIKPEPAYRWARCIGNQDIMMDKINESEQDYEWASDIGNRDVMVDMVIELEWIETWNNTLPDDKIS